jgi:hypothetical protein
MEIGKAKFENAKFDEAHSQEWLCHSLETAQPSGSGLG